MDHLYWEVWSPQKSWKFITDIILTKNTIFTPEFERTFLSLTVARGLLAFVFTEQLNSMQAKTDFNFQFSNVIGSSACRAGPRTNHVASSESQKRILLASNWVARLVKVAEVTRES